MATAIVSAFTNRPVRRDVAMTGEITLRGNVLPIGGLKEKVLAAHRAKIRTIVMPEANRRNLVDIPKALKKDLEFIPVSHVSEVLEVAVRPDAAPAEMAASGKDGAAGGSRRSRSGSRRTASPSN